MITMSLIKDLKGKAMTNHVGTEMYDLCRELFPINRSITGDGVRQSLRLLREHVPDLKTVEVPSGTQCFDWVVPDEWNIRDAYILTPDGEKICSFQESNLHVVSYSVPVDEVLPLDELQNYLYSRPDKPDAIPFVTSYYTKRWGFCIAHNEREKLKPGNYRVVIDSELKAGSLTYGEVIIPGQTSQEVFLSTHMCHPSMANDQLSGPAVTTFLAKWLQHRNNRYTYRIVIIPTTIGSITYLSRNLVEMKKNIIAGFNIVCVGDDLSYSYSASRQGNALPDRAVRHVLDHLHPGYVKYSYLEREGDERQYCSPGVDLPVCAVMRSKYGCYPEYHTSLDDLSVISPAGLYGAYEVLQKAIECIENNKTYKTKVLCEPQLGKRGLYPTITNKGRGQQVANMMNFLAYADGSQDLLGIADLIGVPFDKLLAVANQLNDAELLEEVNIH